MKKSKIDISLNDSDDAAFLFETGTQKRKMKPVSPKVKRRRGNNKDILTQSAIEKPNLRERKPQLNRSAPETNKSVPIAKELKDLECYNTKDKDIRNCMENGGDKHNEGETSKIQEEQPKKDTIFSRFISKAKAAGPSLTCPLCKKHFENSLTHVTHIKACAKKKKVSATEMLKSLNSMITDYGVNLTQDSALIPSTSKIGDNRTDGLTAPIGSQMATLEKFGFKSSTCASKTGNRRGRLKINRNTILKLRTTEERMRILTEKAAVILLTDENISAVKAEDQGSSIESEFDEIPSSLERPKQNLWNIGNCDKSNGWYIDNLKQFVEERKRLETDPVVENAIEDKCLVSVLSLNPELAVELGSSFEKLEPNENSTSDQSQSPGQESWASEKSILSPNIKYSFPKSVTLVENLSSPKNSSTSSPRKAKKVLATAPIEGQINSSETVVLDSGLPQSPELLVPNEDNNLKCSETVVNHINETPSLGASAVSETSPKCSVLSKKPLPIDTYAKKIILSPNENFHGENATVVEIQDETILSRNNATKSLSPFKNGINNPGTLSENWGKLVGNSLFSDRILIAKDGIVNIHSLVLNARCPGIDMDSLEVPCETINKSSLLIFLKYLYTDILEFEKITYEKQIKELSNIFKRPEVITLLNENKSAIDSNISELAVTPKQSDISVPKLSNNFGDPHLSEADTVPVSILTHDDSIRNDTADLAVVDLTQNDGSDYENPEDKSYWSLLRQNNELDVQLDDERSDVLDKERELAKIQSFFDNNNSQNPKSDSDEDFMIDSRERDKIYNLSQNNCHENDIFDSNDDEDIQVLTQSQKTTAEIVVVSDDSEQRIFDKSTDDDNSNHLNNDFDVPFFESYDNDFIDYDKTANLEDTSPETCEVIGYHKSPELNALSPSQSLVSGPVTPRTPRKVLETPVLQKSLLSSSILDDGIIAESPDDLGEEDRNLIMKDVTLLQLSSPSQHVTPVAGSFLPINHTTPECLPCSSLSSGRKRNNTHLRRTVLSPSSRARRSLLETCATNEAALSTSVVAALDETWQSGDTSSHVTPIANKGQFLEVTPNLTPSTKIVNKVTPRPSYSSMKTGSLKKQLSKYGLKQNLGKVKAKKILRHIYDELHPFVNTKTGKFLRKLPEDSENKSKPLRKNAPKNVKKNESAVNSSSQNCLEKSKNKKPTNTIDGAGRGTEKLSIHKDVDSGNEQPGPLFGARLTERNSGNSEMVNVNSSNDQTGPSFVPPLTEKDGDDSDIIDSDHSNYSEDEFDMDCEDDGVLTQANTNLKCFSAGEIILKFINDNKELHESILKYEPIWIESLKKNIFASYNVRLKIKDLVSYLDSACIIWRSETQAANLKKRNEKTKQRRLKRKEKMKTSLASQ